MPREPLLITVKTYPTLSRKYGETVCTAGIRPDGSWVRIYPVPFRRLDETEQYRKFDWVNVELVRNTSDHRPETFALIPKLPYSFSYHFEDAVGRHSTLQVLDWECGQLYQNCLRRNGGDEDDALTKVRSKYFDEFGRRDLHFLLGTTQQFHGFAPNPWVIVGVFAPPRVNQTEFDLGV